MLGLWSIKKGEDEMSQSELNMEPTIQYKFLLKIYEIVYYVLSTNRELSANNEIFTL
jgi:hypothetical protein